jgi:hypothetical protein
MNHSIATADRNTHLKVAALALVASIAVVVVGFSARVGESGMVTARGESTGPAFKAGKITQFTKRSDLEIR